MTHTAPADQIVLEYNAIAGRRLATQPAYKAVTGTGLPCVYLTPTPWTEFYGRWSPPGGEPQAVIFLHRRVSPSGLDRLVMVAIGNPGHEGPIYADIGVTIPLRLHARVFRPASLVRSGREARDHAQPLARRPIRVHAGQPDPTDPSHFTIVYETESQWHTIDGWLRDDDTVLLEDRDPTPVIPSPEATVLPVPDSIEVKLPNGPKAKPAVP